MSKKAGVLTLAFDVGGTGIKGALLDEKAHMVSDHLHVQTPHPAPPDRVLPILRDLAGRLPRFDRVSVGFPGVVRRGRILTAPHLGTVAWHGFRLAEVLAKEFGKPTRVLNDAEVQGFGVVGGRGLECVLTLGTGIGSAIFHDGLLTPHLELGQHPLHKKKTYDEYIGEAALEAKGHKRWGRRVARTIGVVRTLLNFDVLYLGGGNSAHLDLDLPKDIKIVSNSAGITGGVRLWDSRNEQLFALPPRRGLAMHGVVGGKGGDP